MPTSRKRQKSQKRFIGRFRLSDGAAEVGELRLEGRATLLKLHSDNNLESLGKTDYIQGDAYTGECLSLIGCFSAGVASTYKRDQPVRYHAEVFPHYVVVGNDYLTPDLAVIRRIEFSTPDMSSIFHDSRAFGQVTGNQNLMELLLKEKSDFAVKNGYKAPEVPIGDMPIITYFTGRQRMLEVSTAIGLVTADHYPSSGMGSPRGIAIQNRIVVAITPDQPATLQQAMSAVHQMSSFLSVIAGRHQKAQKIRVETGTSENGIPILLSVHASMLVKGRGKGDSRDTRPGDVPLDAIQRPHEFSAVLTNWMARHEDWRVARTRALDCLRKANHYGPDRMVAAANMFDLLPANATSLPVTLSAELIKARDDCKRILKPLDPGPDRDSVLGSLGRMGQPSLAKKVLHRASIITAVAPSVFPRLDHVVVLAVKCRNYFVHGGGDFDFNKYENSMPFFNDTLEFIFSASDLIEAGWDMAQWLTRPHSWGHNFSIYRLGYLERLAELLKAG